MEFDGSSVEYKCHDRFSLLGSSTALCQNGRWSSPPPICVGQYIHQTCTNCVFFKVSITDYRDCSTVYRVQRTLQQTTGKRNIFSRSVYTVDRAIILLKGSCDPSTEGSLARSSMYCGSVSRSNCIFANELSKFCGNFLTDFQYSFAGNRCEHLSRCGVRAQR